jgi:hypothetical protein
MKHVISDESYGQPYDTCQRCGKPVNDYGDGRGPVTILGENPECYGR